MADNKNIIDEVRDSKDANEPELRYQDEVPVFCERKRWLFFGLPCLSSTLRLVSILNPPIV